MKDQKIEVPPLPAELRDVEPEARAYARAAVEPYAKRIAELEADLQAQDREAVKRPVLDSIVDEIHRRADKEWADDGYDFEVTITADDYKALCKEERVIDHARRIEEERE